MSEQPQIIKERWAVRLWLPGGFLAVLAAFYLYLGLTIQGYNCDNVKDLLSASRISRTTIYYKTYIGPPLTPYFYAPALAAIHLGASRVMAERLVHLTAIGLTLITLAAVYWYLSRAFSREFALLGAGLLGAGPLILRYAPYPGIDIPGLFFYIGSFLSYVRWKQLEKRRYLFNAVLMTALAISTRYNFAIIFLSFYLLEILSGLGKKETLRRLLLPRSFFVFLFWFFVAYTLVSAAFLYPLMRVFNLSALFIARYFMFAIQMIRHVGVDEVVASTVGDRSFFTLKALILQLGAPLLLMALGGIYLGIRERRVWDLYSLIWLAGFITPTLLLISHLEARYLLPALPPLLYFSLRLMEWMVNLVSGNKRSIGSVGSVMAALAVLLILPQTVPAIKRYQDSFYRRNPSREVFITARNLVLSGREILYSGGLYPFHPQEYKVLPHDDFFLLFHLSPIDPYLHLNYPGKQIEPPDHRWRYNQNGKIPLVPDGPLFIHDEDVAIVNPTWHIFKTDILPEKMPPLCVVKYGRRDLSRVSGGDEEVIFKDARNNAQVGIKLRDNTLHYTGEHDLGLAEVSFFVKQNSPPSAYRVFNLKRGENIIQPPLIPQMIREADSLSIIYILEGKAFSEYGEKIPWPY